MQLQLTSVDALLHFVLFDWNSVGAHTFLGEVLLPISELTTVNAAPRTETDEREIWKRLTLCMHAHLEIGLIDGSPP